LRFIFQGINLKIETKKAPKVLNHQKVILGIRPEHVSLTDNGSSAVNASVLLVEQMGANTLTVYKLVDSPKDIKLRVLSGRQTHAHEDAVDRLYLDLKHIHIFDAETGINLA
jgi:sn-glycerol 3-phosphate transport system ATP-binding protein